MNTSPAGERQVYEKPALAGDCVKPFAAAVFLRAGVLTMSILVENPAVLDGMQRAREVVDYSRACGTAWMSFQRGTRELAILAWARSKRAQRLRVAH